MVEAPGLFSTITGCFQICERLSPSARAIASTPPPAGYGTTMRTSRFGNSCACAGSIAASESRIAVAIFDISIMLYSSNNTATPLACSAGTTRRPCASAKAKP